ncbi:MAG: hypothetical protein KAJ29_02000 [Alphaproteobacteria bacterium]|nr:hypothetical protein [Alphaproteobacteria bacterium]
MGEDIKDTEDELVGRLTNEKLGEIIKNISKIYSELTQQNFENTEIEKALVSGTRMSMIKEASIVEKGDREEINRIAMNGDLTFIVEELRKNSAFFDEVLHALERGVASDNATREPENVFPTCVL